MANYNKSVNFAVKDTLQSGDPNKIVSGAEIDTEFNNIASSSTTKIDKVSAAQVNNIASFNATGGIQDSGNPSTALIPSGGIILWSGLLTSIPAGWSLCDGSNNTPDLRDRFVVGAGSTYGRNEKGGAASVALSENELPSHNHTTNSAGNHNHGGSTGADGSHNHTMNNAGAHTHPGTTSTDGEHRHGLPCDNDGGKGGGAQFASDGEGRVRTNLSDFAGNHSHTLNILNSGLHTHTINSVGNHTHNISSDGNHTHTINNTGGNAAHENRPPYFALAYIMKL